MEGSEQFGTEITSTDDPFAGTDFGDFEGEKTPPKTDEEIAAEMGEGLPGAPAEVPVVDKEGAVVGSAPVEPAPDPTPEAPAESAGPTEEPAEVAPSEPAAEPAQEPAGAPEAPPEVAPEPPEPQEGSPEPAPAAPEDAPAATSEPESDDQSQEDEPQAEPEARTDDQGRVTHRRYVVLRVASPGKYEQLSWHVDSEGKIAPKGPGTKRQSLVVARSAPDALVFGYKVVGAPPDGAVLIAIPESAFQLKTIKPKPPEPSRTRLQIG